jgi:DNA-binding NarL/FixJ family response regulator
VGADMLERPERRVLVVDSHRCSAESLAIAIDAHEGLCCVGTTASADAALEATVRGRPDVVLVELDLPGVPVGQLVAELRRWCPGLAVLAIAGCLDASQIAAVARDGVCGLVRRSSSLRDVIAALRTARGGRLTMDAVVLDAMTSQAARPEPRTSVEVAGVRLTPREREVLELLCQANDARGIATRLGISIHTTRGYLKTLLAKFGAHSQVELVVRARAGDPVAAPPLDPAVVAPVAAAPAEPIALEGVGRLPATSVA